MKLSESDDFSQTTTASMRFLEIPISRLRMEVVFSYFLGVSNLGNFEDKSHEGSSCQLSGIWILRRWSRRKTTTVIVDSGTSQGVYDPIVMGSMVEKLPHEG